MLKHCVYIHYLLCLHHTYLYCTYVYYFYAIHSYLQRLFGFPIYMSVNNRDVTVSLYISDYFEPTNGSIVCMELLREKDSCTMNPAWVKLRLRITAYNDMLHCLPQCGKSQNDANNRFSFTRIMCFSMFHRRNSSTPPLPLKATL